MAFRDKLHAFISGGYSSWSQYQSWGGYRCFAIDGYFY